MAVKITADRLRMGLTRLRNELLLGPPGSLLQIMALDDLLTSAESVARLASILDEGWNIDRGPREGHLDMEVDYSAEVFPTQDGPL